MHARIFCLCVASLFMGASAAAETIGQTCATAAGAFFTSLSEEQKSHAVRSFDHEGRKKWTNLPGTRFRDEGLPFEEMAEVQRILGHRLI